MSNTKTGWWPLQPAFEGLWYSPDTSGQGFSLSFFPTGDGPPLTMFMVIYGVHDDNYWVTAQDIVENRYESGPDHYAFDLWRQGVRVGRMTLKVLSDTQLELHYVMYLPDDTRVEYGPHTQVRLSRPHEPVVRCLGLGEQPSPPRPPSKWCHAR